MALVPGSRLGPYEIQSAIGAGGMGEVYRATDSNLKRSVAIKVLPTSVAGDADRLARFQREAEVLAALNHPSIAAIYGFERSSDLTALVMELVEGEDLSQRIARGAIPIEEALPIAKQIAEGLEAAHERGIIHRDLKPANIKVRSDGTVKVLDFGLAKALEPPVSGTGTGAGRASMSPTLSFHATQAGVILGTAAYMAPEQAKGLPADKRADLWAFGCVVYEMLTGRGLFGRGDVTETFVAVLRDEPDWNALPANTPTAIRRLLQRCVRKNPKLRLDSAAAARLEIEESVGGETPSTPVRRSRQWVALPALIAGVAVGALALYTVMPRRVAIGGHDVTRLTIGIAPADQITAARDDPTSNLGRPTRTSIAISPDGRLMVFGAVQGGRVQLFQRALDRLDVTGIPGTEGGMGPFFSPDGHWIGFWANGALRKMSVASGGPSTAICEIADSSFFGASWGADDTIYLGQLAGPILGISANGGTPHPVTALDTSTGEISHRLPHVLPGAKGLLFTAMRASLPSRWDDPQTITTVAQAQPGGKAVPVLAGGVDARYVSTGHLMFTAAGVLTAAPFDLERLKVTGGSVALISGVSQSTGSDNTRVSTGAVQVAISDAGTLAYITGGIVGEPQRTIAWASQNGTIERVPVAPHGYSALTLSPDGHRAIAWTVPTAWEIDLTTARLTPSALGREPSSPYFTWTPDGGSVVYAAGAPVVGIFQRASDSTDGGQALIKGEHLGLLPFSFTPDGTTLLAADRISPETWALTTIRHVGSSWKMEPYQSTPNARYGMAVVSPDGRWLAFTTNESGSTEVFVRPFPGTGPRQQVSIGGNPTWSRDGRWLYFFGSRHREDGTIAIVGVPVLSGSGPSLSLGAAKTIVTGHFQTAAGRTLDVGPDGRFLVIEESREQPVVSREIVVVLNWSEELKGRVPTK